MAEAFKLFLQAALYHAVHKDISMTSTTSNRLVIPSEFASSKHLQHLHLMIVANHKDPTLEVADEFEGRSFIQIWQLECSVGR